MKRLTEIGIREGTDKANYHGYTEFYDDIFKQYSSPRILEIGIAAGDSIRMYYEYFDEPYILAMDINGVGPIGNCKIIRGDQSNINDLQHCVNGEEPFDIIVDDGGHLMDQQQITFGYLFKHVKSGGYYILEDIHTSFIPNWLYPKNYDRTTYDMLKMIEQKQLGFSNFIDEESQQFIINNIDTIEFWSRIPGDFNDSATCVMKIK
jgi:demethylmacrocin O-methyltransferase